MIEPFELKSFLDSAHSETTFNLSKSLAEGPPDVDGVPFLPSAKLSYEACRTYPGMHGGIALKQAVAGLLKTPATTEDIVLVNGADEALSLASLALIQPGDHVVVLHPCYTPMIALPRWRGAQVSKWSCRESLGWAPCLAELEALCANGVDYLILSIPQNPTGWSPDRETLQEICNIVESRGGRIFSDEVYSGLNHNGTPSTSALSFSARSIVVGSLSKAFALPGLRVGWLACRDATIIARCMQTQAYLNSYVSQPVEAIALAAIARAEHILTNSQKTAKQNREVLREFVCRENKVSSSSLPDAGVVAMLRWHGSMDAESLSHIMLRQHNLLLVSSVKFKFGRRHFRIGFGTSDFPKSLAVFEKAIAEIS